jgi:hypothetical protein
MERRKPGRPYTYPFDEMAVGAVEKWQCASEQDLKNVRSSVLGHGRRTGKLFFTKKAGLVLTISREG